MLNQLDLDRLEHQSTPDPLMSLRARGEDPPEARIPAWVESFRALWRAGDGAAISALLWYLVNVSGEENSRVVDAVIQAEPGIQEAYVTLYDRILKEGEARGIERGEATVLEKQLRLRFGELPEDLRARLAHAKTPELERWAERILSADTLEEVFREP